MQYKKYKVIRLYNVEYSRTPIRYCNILYNAIFVEYNRVSCSLV